MFKSIKSIFSLIIVVLLSFILFFGIPMFYLKISEDNTIYSKDVNINTVNEKYLQITENVVVDISDNDIKQLSFPISLYREYNNGYVDLIDTKITVNNKEILTKYENDILLYKENMLQKYNNNNLNNTKLYENINRDIIYSNSVNDISISRKNNINFKPGKYVITLSYKCNINDFISNYNNIAILKINRNTKFDNLNITMTLPRESSIFKVNSNKAKIENISNNTYKVELSDVKISNKFDYVSFTFDNNIFSNAKIINENYEILKETNIFANEDEADKIYFFIISIITLTLFVIILIITKKVKLEKNYVRDTKSVISPILAESLIDRKMRLKRTYNDMYC